MRRNLYDGEKDGKYYVMSPSEITDDLRNQAADDYAKFMTADSYKTYTKAYNVFIKRTRGMRRKLQISWMQSRREAAAG